MFRIFHSEIRDPEPTTDQLFILHSTIKKVILFTRYLFVFTFELQVSEDTEGLRFNTAIASMMEFSNAAVKWDPKPKSILEPFLLLLAPYAPHLSEELWQKLGHVTTLAYEPWPQWNEAHLQVTPPKTTTHVNALSRLQT